MCGIAGVFHFDHQRHIDEQRLKKMSDVIAHRGPDGEGFFIDKNIGLAHRRLSIIDLASGVQPMFSDDRKIIIVFNGEIYNYLEIKKELEVLGHHFKTTSDTEVIIAAYRQWDIRCQEKFNGMWSFAIWDDKKKRLFISRDRLGEKPLNYGVFDQTFLFGSEIKSFSAYGVNLKPNFDLLELYFFLGYVPEPYTFYQGIQKLKAGHYLIVEGSRATEYKYWDLPEVDEGNMLTNELDVVKNFEDLFEDSVQLRMRSDVAYGAFLSGGLDSSSIVSVMSENSDKPIETFTIGFKEKKFDERDMANIVANRFKTNHHSHIVELDTLDHSLESILFHYDEPFADAAAIPTEIVSKYAAERVKMVLTGDGADEVLAGYSSYQSEQMAGNYQKWPGFIKRGLPFLIGQGARLLNGELRYKANRAARVLQNFNSSFQDRLISKSVKISPQRMKSLYTGQPIAIEDFINEALKGSPFKDPFYQMMYYNLKVSLPGQMLVKVDKMSMAHSIETRAPFLDHRIVEYMYGVHKNIKMPNNRSVKNVLKKAMHGKVPAEILNRKKKGFDVPLREWFKDDVFDKKLEWASDAFGLNGKVISDIMMENKSGKADHGALIWRLLIYRGWNQQF